MIKIEDEEEEEERADQQQQQHQQRQLLKCEENKSPLQCKYCKRIFSQKYYTSVHEKNTCRLRPGGICVNVLCLKSNTLTFYRKKK